MGTEPGFPIANGALEQHPILEWLRTYKPGVYESLLCDKEVTNVHAKAFRAVNYTPLVLLPRLKSLQNTGICDAIVDAHVLHPTELPHHYLNLLGHALLIRTGRLYGLLGFTDSLVPAELSFSSILDQHFVNHQERRLKVLIIERPVPDRVVLPRPLASQANYEVTAEGSVPGASSSQDRDDPTLSSTQTKGHPSTLFALGLISPEVSSETISTLVSSWGSWWPVFGRTLERTLTRLEQTLLLVPGYTEDVAQKYRKVVIDTLLPTVLAQAETFRRQDGGPSLKESLADIMVHSAPSRPNRSQTSASALGSASSAFLTLPEKQTVALVLERCIYMRFASTIWAYLQASSQDLKEAVAFYKRSVADGGGFIHRFGRTPQDHEFLADSSSFADQTPGIRSSHIQQWLRLRGMKQSGEILDRLSAREGVVDTMMKSRAHV